MNWQVNITSEPAPIQGHDKWQYHVIDAYKPLVSTKGWRICPKCKEFPRLWIFDNGRYAKCCCGYKYEASGVKAEPIMEYVRRNNGSMLGFDDLELQRNWNDRVKKLKDKP